jgi:hypothetical protein
MHRAKEGSIEEEAHSLPKAGTVFISYPDHHGNVGISLAYARY